MAWLHTITYRMPFWQVTILFKYFLMGQSWPLLFIFVFSTLHNSINWWKCRWCAWDSNMGRQDGKRTRIDWAMAAPLFRYVIVLNCPFVIPVTVAKVTLSNCLSMTWQSFWLNGGGIKQSITFTHTFVEISHGLVVMGWNSQYKGCGFESQHHIREEHF